SPISLSQYRRFDLDGDLTIADWIRGLRRDHRLAVLDDQGQVLVNFRRAQRDLPRFRRVLEKRRIRQVVLKVQHETNLVVSQQSWLNVHVQRDRTEAGVIRR